VKCSLSLVSVIFIVLLFFSRALNAQETTHTVGKGETIYSISRLYRVSPDELMKVNGIADPSKLQTGKKLVVPNVSFNETEIKPAANTSRTVLTNYRVKKGDTLYSIARNNNTDISTLLETNNFSKDHVIKADDVIKIPVKETVVIANNTPKADTAKNTNTASPKKIDASVRWPINALGIDYMKGQLGVIVNGTPGEPVKSIMAGKVISAGPWRKFGKVAIVEVTGGYFYMYGGCDSLSVKVGDKVDPGTELGKLGINAASDKPQLFFMVFKSNTPIDPAGAPRAAAQITHSKGS